MRRLVAASLAAVGLLVASACSGAAEPPVAEPALAWPPVVVSQLEGRTLLVNPDDNGVGMDSELRGRVEVGADGCLGVLAEPGAAFALVVFPHGTDWVGPDRLVLGPGQVLVGEEVTLGGGFVSPDDLHLDGTAAAGCVGTAQVFLAH